MREGGRAERPTLFVFRLAVRVSLAGEQGFEPQLPDPESGVLPLDDSPKRVDESSTRQKSCSTQSSHTLPEVAPSSSATWAYAAVTVLRASAMVVTGVVPPGTGV